MTQEIRPFFAWIAAMVLGACVSDLSVEARDGQGDAGGNDASSTAGSGGNDATGGGRSGGAGGGTSGTGSSDSGGTTATGGTPSNGGSSGDGGAGDGGSGGTGGTGTGGAGTGGTGTGGTGTGGTGTGGTGTGGAPPVEACRAGQFDGVLFCDDFERSGLPGWSRLSNAGSDGETVRSGNPHHGGSWAVRSTKFDPGPLDPLYADVLGDRTSGKLFVRVWMYIPSNFVISAAGNASILALGQAPPSDGGVSIAMWQSALSLQVYDPNEPVLPYIQPAAYQTTLPRDQWFCAQLEFPIGTSVSSSEFKLRINGNELVNSEPETTLDSTLSSPYDRLWLGVNYVNDQQADDVTVHYDDVAVDTVDVPCQ